MNFVKCHISWHNHRRKRRGAGGARAPPEFGKIFSGNYYVKFEHFSGNNRVKFGNFVIFFEKNIIKIRAFFYFFSGQESCKILAFW